VHPGVAPTQEVQSVIVWTAKRVVVVEGVGSVVVVEKVSIWVFGTKTVVDTL
jgi:hypothetical protein